MLAREWRAAREGDAHAAHRNRSRTPENFIVGVGASGALLAGAAIVFVTLVGLTSFNIWPVSHDVAGGGNPQLGTAKSVPLNTSPAPLSAATGQLASTGVGAGPGTTGGPAGGSGGGGGAGGGAPKKGGSPKNPGASPSPAPAPAPAPVNPPPSGREGNPGQGSGSDENQGGKVPPGQAKKSGNNTSSPGNSGNAPGHSGSHGNSGGSKESSGGSHGRGGGKHAADTAAVQESASTGGPGPGSGDESDDRGHGPKSSKH